MKHLYILITAITLFASNTSYSANFDGLYLGVQAGYEKLSIRDKFTLYGFDQETSANSSSGIGGLYIGYGKRFNSLYLGVEADSFIGSGNYNNLHYSTKAEQNATSYSASVRAGFLPTDNVLLYSRLGLANGSIDTEDFSCCTVSSKNKTSLNGFRVGLGAEKLITGNIIARLDWAYTKYQSYDIDYTYAGMNSGTDRVSPSSNTILAGLGYNF